LFCVFIFLIILIIKTLRSEIAKLANAEKINMRVFL